MSLPPVDTALSSTVRLEHRYADALPELCVPWQAAEVPEPRLLVLNDPLAAELGLDTEWLRTPDGVRFLVGNEVPDGARPVAQVYAGHQFGGYSSRLGDGRALLLGELTTPDGRLLDLALKGSGRTPFARGGDGLAAVGPMLREFVISEAMHALGIPTTRSLAVISTGTAVARDTGMLPGAVLTRVASSHLRVGTFQYARSTDDLGLLRRLADHAIARHHARAADADNPYLALLDAVVAAQADLVARWMGVGFVHGVMNTDNMTISGETIDYGPCAFMEAYDEAAVYSSIDTGGRYAFGQQPGIAQWNLARLAESLLPLIDESQDRAVALAQESLGSFAAQYGQARAEGLRAKLGLPQGLAAGVADPLADDLLRLLAEHRADHTLSFRALSALARGGAAAGVLAAPGVAAWTQQWLGLEPDADAMDRVNPVHVPRNQRVEEALAAATEAELGPLVPLLDAVTHPFEDLVGLELFSLPADDAFGDYTTFCGT